ncbi:uroporphyrinogen decarboxylase, partial [Candidatus Sumerlaeota bacterium]|nr:uroporphyrinogen decarboxylase [Candidatus Sumerlaeota bacterium]
IEAVAEISKPDPRCDGLPPFVLKRLTHLQSRIEAEGHAIRFAVSRGPLNVASFLLGNTEFLTALRMTPEPIHHLLEIITDFTVDWLQLQAKTFPTIDGVLILDDIVGFLGEEDFLRFAEPHLRAVFQALDVTVRFFHNDAPGRICAPHLAGLGVNLFNFSHEHSLAEMREWTGGEVTLLGNIPPRDVMADGTPEEVRRAVRHAIDPLDDTRRLILSCGGGMPPGAPTENIEAFLDACGHRLKR